MDSEPTFFLAKTVQEMLGVEPWETLASGYTLDRDDLDFYFDDKGNLIRYCGDKAEIYQYFDGDVFFNNLKRLYRKDTNPKLVSYFMTFGRPLPLID